MSRVIVKKHHTFLYTFSPVVYDGTSEYTVVPIGIKWFNNVAFMFYNEQTLHPKCSQMFQV